MMERSVALHGDSLSLEGPELAVGDKAPAATLRSDLGTEFDLSALSGKVRILSVVPSLDTPVCAEQTKRFNVEAAGMSDVAICTISCDLPTAMARFCGAESIDQDRIQVLSDHMDVAFGRAYGTLLPGLRILCRAIFVVGADDTLQYVEYVSEISEHPDYDAVLKCVKGL